MKKAGGLCVWILENVMAIILLVLTLLIFVNVVLRYLMNSGIDISEELARFMFVWLTFIAAIIASIDNSHVSAGALIERLPRFLQKPIRLLTSLLVIGCCLLLTVSSWRHARMNWGNLAPVSGISSAWIFVAGSLGGIGVAVVTARNAVRILLGRDAPRKEGAE